MTELANLARPAVETLLQVDEDGLYEALAIRVEAMKSDPAKAGSFAPDVTYEADKMGALDDLRDWGRTFFEKFFADAYDLVCGTEAEDSEERKTVMDAFGINKETVAAAIAGLLVAQLTIAPAIAAVVAALIVKLVFRNAYDAMCKVWKDKLPQEGS